jgi:energy-converting hydrogenase Eha subunit E
MELLITGTLIVIIASLGRALYSMAAGPADSNQMVRALTVRIGLSVVLFALLMIGWHFGYIEPHAVK